MNAILPDRQLLDYAAHFLRASGNQEAAQFVTSVTRIKRTRVRWLDAVPRVHHGFEAVLYVPASKFRNWERLRYDVASAIERISSEHDPDSQRVEFVDAMPLYGTEPNDKLTDNGPAQAPAHAAPMHQDTRALIATLITAYATDPAHYSAAARNLDRLPAWERDKAMKVLRLLFGDLPGADRTSG